VSLALTTPSPDATNTIDVGGATKTGNVSVDTATASVVITGVKTSAQTVVIGGADLSDVTASGTATAPIYTIDTSSITGGGFKVFTLTVSEALNLDIVYAITVIVA